LPTACSIAFFISFLIIFFNLPHFMLK